jgi:hypothetical protein
MPNIEEMCSNVMLRLGDPRAQRPSYYAILNQVMTQTRTVLRHKHNTGNVWNYSDLTIQVTPNVAVYQITAPDFGTPLAVITYAPGLISWIPRLIPFFGPQNLQFDWNLPTNLAANFYIPYDGSNCTAQRCAFYWKANVPYIEFAPLPLLSAQYQIKFLQNSNNTYSDALTASPEWSEDADLIEVRSALALLPLAEWNAPDSKEGRAYNLERRQGLILSLSAEEKELTRQFEAAALNFSGPAMTRRWNPCVG